MAATWTGKIVTQQVSIENATVSVQVEFSDIADPARILATGAFQFPLKGASNADITREIRAKGRELRRAYEDAQVMASLVDFTVGNI